MLQVDQAGRRLLAVREVPIRGNHLPSPMVSVVLFYLHGASARRANRPAKTLQAVCVAVVERVSHAVEEVEQGPRAGVRGRRLCGRRALHDCAICCREIGLDAFDEGCR